MGEETLEGEQPENSRSACHRIDVIWPTKCVVDIDAQIEDWESAVEKLLNEDKALRAPANYCDAGDYR